MNTQAPKRLRCAVYTRKSTEEGLDMEYTSIERVIVTPTNLELRLRPGGIGAIATDARLAAEEVVA